MIAPERCDQLTRERSTLALKYCGSLESIRDLIFHNIKILIITNRKLLDFLKLFVCLLLINY